MPAEGAGGAEPPYYSGRGKAVCMGRAAVCQSMRKRRHAALRHALPKGTTRSNQEQELPTTSQTTKSYGIWFTPILVSILMTTWKQQLNQDLAAFQQDASAVGSALRTFLQQMESGTVWTGPTARTSISEMQGWIQSISTGMDNQATEIQQQLGQVLGDVQDVHLDDVRGGLCPFWNLRVRRRDVRYWEVAHIVVAMGRAAGRVRGRPARRGPRPVAGDVFLFECR